MKDITLKGFEEALAKDDAQQKQRQGVAKLAANAEQKFREEFSKRFDEQILPTFDELRRMLEDKGWRVEVSEERTKLIASIAISRGNMTAAGGQQRPHLTIRADAATQQVLISTMSITQGDGAKILPMHDLTSETIAAWALVLFQRLVDGK